MTPEAKSAVPKAPGARLLMVSAPYYRDIVEQLQRGVEAVAAEAEAGLDRIYVPGAFELPAAIVHAAKTGAYDGYVALGCVVRGATTHYDYICAETARALMDLSVQNGLAIGYGILTVENLGQAEERADPRRRDKGGEAARACLAVIALQRRFGGQAR